MLSERGRAAAAGARCARSRYNAVYGFLVAAFLALVVVDAVESLGLNVHPWVAVAKALLLVAQFAFLWAKIAEPLRMRWRLRRKGYQQASFAQALSAQFCFGDAAQEFLPPGEEVAVLPREPNETESQFLLRLLLSVCFDREPKHFSLLAKGYYDLTREQHDAILDTFAEKAVLELPEVGWWNERRIARQGGQFEFIIHRLERNQEIGQAAA